MHPQLMKIVAEHRIDSLRADARGRKLQPTAHRDISVRQLRRSLSSRVRLSLDSDAIVRDSIASPGRSL